MPAAPTVSEPPAPTFNLPPREAADSILGDPNESEDDVFGSQGEKQVPVPQLPDVPPEEPPPAPPPAPPVVASPPPPPPPPIPVPEPEPEPLPKDNPFAFDDAPPRPAPAPASPKSVMPPAAAPVPVPQPVLPQPAPVVATPQPLPIDEPVDAEELPPDEPAEKPTKKPAKKPAGYSRSRGGDEAGPSGVPKAVVILLGLYALVMTGLAAYGLFFKSGSLPSDHPLSTIPDTFGEHDPASRKQVSQFTFPIDGELPKTQVAKIGDKIEIGKLAVKPVGITARELRIYGQKGNTEQLISRPGEGLVLKLEVTNNTDVAFCPLDPAFNRATYDRSKLKWPATRIVAGKEVFAGGPIVWPFKDEIRQFEEEQKDEHQPLKPGETRTYTVCSKVHDSDLLRTVRDATEPVMWRVQIRRGLFDYEGQEIPVTAIIGVEFTPRDVRGL